MFGLFLTEIISVLFETNAGLHGLFFVLQRHHVYLLSVGLIVISTIIITYLLRLRETVCFVGPETAVIARGEAEADG